MKEITLDTGTGKTRISVGTGLTSGLTALKGRTVLLVDENVLGLHGKQLEGFQSIPIPSGEKHKTLRTVEKVYRSLTGLECDRDTLLVGIGGGLATDVAGFVASTFLRGVPFGFISTTLLGQVDASIGGKNGVNLDGYKNRVGVIRQPGFVWCDISLLRTLEEREYISGLAEVIKYGAIRNRDLLFYVKENLDSITSRDPKVLEQIVTSSAAIKVDIVQQDEWEGGLRRLLNFGHTIGHAIERNSDLLHGEAISIGMVLAARLSGNLGYISHSEVDFIQSLISESGLPVEKELDPDEVFENIRKDKKKSGEHIRFILIRKPGEAFVREIPLTELKSMLHDLC